VDVYAYVQTHAHDHNNHTKSRTSMLAHKTTHTNTCKHAFLYICIKAVHVKTFREGWVIKRGCFYCAGRCMCPDLWINTGESLSLAFSLSLSETLSPPFSLCFSLSHSLILSVCRSRSVFLSVSVFRERERARERESERARERESERARERESKRAREQEN